MKLENIERGLVLRHLRNRNGFTQEELARRSGVRTNTIARMERGVLGFSGESAHKLAKALCVSVAAFDASTLASAAGKAIDVSAVAGELTELKKRLNHLEKVLRSVALQSSGVDNASEPRKRRQGRRGA